MLTPAFIPATQLVRQTPLYNTLAPTPSTAPPVLFEPPGALTGMRHEVWLAAAGGEGWGGCQVWASLNGDTYRMMGMIFPGAVVGALTMPLPSAADPDTTSVCTVNVAQSRGEIWPENDDGADTFVSLCWVGGELVAHTAARLVGRYVYCFDRRMRRGVFGTPIGNHPIGARFARLNNSVWRHPYPAHLVGRTLHVKLPAFNPWGQEQQGVDQVEAHTMTITGASVK